MQYKEFSTGGCVVHSVPHKKGIASVWFKPDGSVIDIEYWPDENNRKRTYGLKENSPVRMEIIALANSFRIRSGHKEVK